MRRKLRTFAVAGAGALALLLASMAGTAVAKDRNHDSIPDKWEKKFHLSLKRDQANKDQDRDRVDNLNEFQEKTNPRRKDTNRNGRPDGKEDRDRDGLNNKMEDATVNLPNDRDTDDDGIEDGAEMAGVVASFDGTTLTIDLQGGGQVSGAVTDQTEIKCETEDEQEQDNSGPGPNSGPRTASAASGGADDPAGDDNGGQNEVENETEVENEVENETEDEHARVCTTADLTPGTPVHEAELEGTAFHEVELVK
jgi:hypothetical protein